MLLVELHCMALACIRGCAKSVVTRFIYCSMVHVCADCMLGAKYATTYAGLHAPPIFLVLAPLTEYKNFRVANYTSVCRGLPMPGISDHPCLLEQTLLCIFLKK